MDGAEGDAAFGTLDDDALDRSELGGAALDDVVEVTAPLKEPATLEDAAMV